MINKNQLDEIILNSLYLMGGSNKTPFNDIIFFDEEKDIDKGIYSKVLNTLYNSDDEYLFSDLIDEFDENDDYEKEYIEIKEEEENTKKENTKREQFPLDEPIIKLDPEVYKDIDVNKFDLSLNALNEETTEEIASIAMLLSKLYDKHKEMIDMVSKGITDKDKYYKKHLEKMKLIYDVYNKMLLEKVYSEYTIKEYEKQHQEHVFLRLMDMLTDGDNIELISEENSKIYSDIEKGFMKLELDIMDTKINSLNESIADVSNNLQHTVKDIEEKDWGNKLKKALDSQ